MGPCTANARRPTVDSRCRGTTISCSVWLTWDAACRQHRWLVCNSRLGTYYAGSAYNCVLRKQWLATILRYWLEITDATVVTLVAVEITGSCWRNVLQLRWAQSLLRIRKSSSLTWLWMLLWCLMNFFRWTWLESRRFREVLLRYACLKESSVLTAPCYCVYIVNLVPKQTCVFVCVVWFLLEAARISKLHSWYHCGFWCCYKYGASR